MHLISLCDYTIISWNRMVLLHGPPGTGTKMQYIYTYIYTYTYTYMYTYYSSMKIVYAPYKLMWLYNHIMESNGATTWTTWYWYKDAIYIYIYIYIYVYILFEYMKIMYAPYKLMWLYNHIMESNGATTWTTWHWYKPFYIILVSYTPVYSPPPTYSLVFLFRTPMCFFD
jgi:hypothetical protein